MINLNIDIGVLIVQVITFLIGMILIWQIFLKKFLATLSERSNHIKATLDTIEKQSIEVAALKSDFTKQLETIEKKFQEKIREATKEGNEIKNGIIFKARTEAKELLEKTSEKLVIEKERMLKEMRHEMAALGIKIAEKVIKESVSKETQDKLITNILKDFEKK
ncbi:MAG: F0F1 ATP synthase subunit B [Candidatus Firestonebacteria bacterium]|nr:F0F1 ATP synthase subunit B [Candidatus Firestonebacteria bacterium]